MALHDVDQKYLGQWATATRQACPDLSHGYSMSLGIGWRMAPLVVEIRRRRKSGRPMDRETRALQDRILLLAHYGIEVVRERLLLNRFHEIFGQDALLMGVKLRASYYHVICLLRNEPAVPMAPYFYEERSSNPAHNNSSNNSPAGTRTATGGESSTGRAASEATPLRQTMVQLSPTMQEAIIRDNALSNDSQTSNLTNPFSSNSELPQPPPGLSDYHPTNARREQEWVETPEPDNFLYKKGDWRQAVNTYFVDAMTIFRALPGSDPLRAILAAEYCAFQWDCMGDYDACRVFAQHAINDAYNSPHPISDEAFKDTSDIVLLLGSMKGRLNPVSSTSTLARSKAIRRRSHQNARQHHRQIPRLVRPT